ncbi:hypothetical protein GOODEAATRI_027443 [Goodea atripinnis]|uniref:Uncharacterized protein n=1 Tax=Goodea atripinnis TaxID=208336 RepID=A0ABV0PS65_9TELE
MLLSQRKPSKNSSNPIQLKLSNFTSKVSSEASCENSEANTTTCESMEEENCEWNEKNKKVEGGSEAILAEIANLKSDFSSRLDSILSPIEKVKKDVNGCAELVGEAEVWISAAVYKLGSRSSKIKIKSSKGKCWT